MTGSIQLCHNRLIADSATWFPLDAYSDSIGPYDPLDLRSNETLCVSDREPSVHAKLITGYPNRTTWIVNGPQLLGSGYEVVQDLSFRAWRVNRVVSTSNVTSAEEHSFVETRAMQDLESVRKAYRRVLVAVFGEFPDPWLAQLPSARGAEPLLVVRDAARARPVFSRQANCSCQ